MWTTCASRWPGCCTRASASTTRRCRWKPATAAAGAYMTDAGGDAALPVLYADDALAVVCKPAGLMVHDSALARGETDFAADRLREQFGRPIFLVHRLDRA